MNRICVITSVWRSCVDSYSDNVPFLDEKLGSISSEAWEVAVVVVGGVVVDILLGPASLEHNDVLWRNLAELRLKSQNIVHSELVVTVLLDDGRDVDYSSSSCKIIESQLVDCSPVLEPVGWRIDVSTHIARHGEVALLEALYLLLEGSIVVFGTRVPQVDVPQFSEASSLFGLWVRHHIFQTGHATNFRPYYVRAVDEFLSKPVRLHLDDFCRYF